MTDVLTPVVSEGFTLLARLKAQIDIRIPGQSEWGQGMLKMADHDLAAVLPAIDCYCRNLVILVASRRDREEVIRFPEDGESTEGTR